MLCENKHILLLNADRFLISGELDILEQQKGPKHRVWSYKFLTVNDIIDICDLPAHQSHNKFWTVAFQKFILNVCFYTYIKNERCTNVHRYTSQSECNTNNQIRIHAVQITLDNCTSHAGTRLLVTTHVTSRHSAIQILTIGLLLWSHLKVNL